ncbi:hypothetical protein [uncultured Parasutterella sp.]|uniref:hypothetical protein n=1 Tax=uncultured Parasutterella sp. TaxID=1263098 RepID=UPI0025972E76|nr:hypothetical protein [uncultured Parasutterella sp.]
MAVYRKIDCRISNDKKFRELSVEGKLAWYTILSRRDLGPIGAFKASFESLASEQRGNKYLHEMVDETVTQTVSEGFSKIFTKALHELLEKGFIKYDSESFLVYVPNFLKYNFPENPNVVKSWNSTIDALPECELTNFVFARSAEIIFNSQKDNLIKVLPKEFVEAYKKQYAEGFNKPFLNGSLNGISNQKQKHKQEQEQKNNEDASSKIAETSLTESDKSLSSPPSLETPKKTSKKAAKAASVELKRPDDVSEELWNAFLDHRKSIKKPFNAYALKLMRNQCAIAGWTLSQAMERVLADGWIGFRASFVKDEWIERLPGTGDKPIMVKREDFMRDQFVASDLSMFTPEAADLIQSVGVQNTRPFKDRIKPLKNVHSEKNVSNPSKVSSEDLSTDIDAFNDIPDDFKEGGER